MNDDGTMARMPDLVAFAQRHNLKIGTIEDLIAHRLRHEAIIRRITERTIESQHGGTFQLHVFQTTVDQAEHLAIVKGDVSAPGAVLVRVHAVDVLRDLIGVGDSGTGSIARAMRMISDEGRGVIVLIRDLRPQSVSERFAARAEAPLRKIQGHERRIVEIGIGSQILRNLGVGEMVLLTNTPDSIYVGVEAFGLKITEQRQIEGP